MVTCYLGVGSNLGNRRKTIQLAIKEIDSLQGTHVVRVSGLIETQPIGGPSGQPMFLNGALKIKTSLSANTLLKKLQSIEHSLGRVRRVSNGPRTIDIDILLYGNETINSANLTVPHPRLFEREFVLKPLAEVFTG